MALTITQRPTKQVGNILSRWTAAHNPVVYKFQRVDRDIDAVVESSGWLRLTLSAGVDGLVVGQYVYMSTNKYKGSVLIEAITPGYIWVSGLTLNGSDGAGYLNETKRNYRIEIKIYEVGTNKLLGSTSCVPFTNGLGIKDVSTYVASYLKLINTFQYNVPNQRDTNGSLKIYITYQELYTGYTGAITADTANPVFVTNSAKQLGEQYGQNMYLYLMKYTNGDDTKSKFLTKFKRPVYFTDQPFSIGFIYSDLMGGFKIKRVESELNINRVTTGSSELLLDDAHAESLNALMLKGSYGAGVKYVKLKLVTGSASDTQYVYAGYVTDGYVAVN